YRGALSVEWFSRYESNRHAFNGGGFSCHFGFCRAAWGHPRFRGLEHAFTLALQALGARRLLSTPSPVPARAWLGVSSSLLLRAFTDFDGLHLGDFSARAQVVLSESAASTNSATRASRDQIWDAEYRGGGAGLKAGLAPLLLCLTRAGQDPRQRIVAFVAGGLVEVAVDRTRRALC